MTKINVLIVSENASNTFGGEAILPLHYFLMLNKKNVNAYLITHERVKKTLEAVDEIDQSKVFYIQESATFRCLDAIGKRFPHRVAWVTTGAIMLFMNMVCHWVIARKVIKEKGINIVHQPAPVSPKLPASLFALGVPVIIGPMNGGINFPNAFRHLVSIFEQCLYPFLRVMSHMLNILIPGKLLADVLLVANERTARALPKLCQGRVMQLVENGVLSSLDQAKEKESAQIHLLFAGRLVDWKMTDILLDVLHQCGDLNLTLTIAGDGPEQNKLMQQAKNLSLSNINFCGFVPFNTMNTYYDAADILVLPSVLECGGAVVLEAMSRGLPVIATNWGGPADYISDETGFLVDPISRDHMVVQIAAHVKTLALDRALRLKMGQAGIDRVKKHFLWDDKINKVIDIYEELV